MHKLSGEILHTVFKKKKKSYRGLEVDKAVPLLKDPLMGQLTHPEPNIKTANNILREKACLKITTRLKDYSKSGPFEKYEPIAHNWVTAQGKLKL